MGEFHLQNWHVMAFFASIFALVFRLHILAFLDGCILIQEIKFKVGQTIEVSYVDGKWYEVKILGYKYPIPFYRIGGLMLEYADDDGRTHIEKLSFHNYHFCRKRWVKKPPAAAAAGS